MTDTLCERLRWPGRALGATSHSALPESSSHYLCCGQWLRIRRLVVGSIRLRALVEFHLALNVCGSVPAELNGLSVTVPARAVGQGASTAQMSVWRAPPASVYEVV